MSISKAQPPKPKMRGRRAPWHHSESPIHKILGPWRPRKIDQTKKSVIPDAPWCWNIMEYLPTFAPKMTQICR